MHKKLPSLTKFQIIPNHIQVISGKWEGIYSWIGINYMLGHFNVSSNQSIVRSAPISNLTKLDSINSAGYFLSVNNRLILSIFF